jgi:hypothetical protein
MNSFLDDEDAHDRAEPHLGSGLRTETRTDTRPDRRTEPQPADREFTLGTGVLLVAFFGLVVLCGAFFGLGYSMGGRRHTPVVADAGDTPSSAAVSSFNQFKPAAGAPAGASPPRAQPAPTPSHAEPDHPAPPAAAAPSPAPAPIVRTTPVETPAQPSPAANATFIVQVAAISVAHPQDADLLVSGLRAKGYAVTAHPEADRFIHVQLGPYANRRDAEAMRNRLQADGYQPYIK